MIAVKTADIRNDFKRVSDLIVSGETVLISRPRNENLVVITEKMYNELEKARRNADYLAKVEKSHQQYLDGRVVVKTMDELEEMAR